MYECTTASMVGMKAKFDVLIGCRHGGQDFPCIFNYYFDYVLKVAANAIDEKFPDGWGTEFDYNIPTESKEESKEENKEESKEVMVNYVASIFSVGYCMLMTL